MGKTLQKTLTVAVSAMTAVWSVGVAAFAPLAAAAAPSAAAVSEGDLIKASLAAVYYVGANGKRYVFPNEKTYKTWWSNFSAVETITDAQLAAVAIGGNVTYRPGARLAKITTDPKVYLVGANAELHSIADESTALDLFGSNWNQKIDDVSDAFFTNYTVSSETVATGLGLGALPVGTLLSYAGEYYLVGVDDVHMVNGDVSIYSSVVMPGSASEFEAWTGLAPADVTDVVEAVDLVGLVTPDRSGTFDGEGGPTPTPSGVSVEVSQIATNLSMASASSQNLGTSVVKVCSDNTITVNGFKVTTVNGTIGMNTIIAWFMDMASGSMYEVTGTSSGDSVGEFEATDAEVTFSGCKEFVFYGATTSNGGVLNLRLVEMSYTSSAAAAVVNAGNAVLQNRNAVPVAATDLMDIAFSNGVNPAALQTDGTKQQVFSVTAAVSNNDAYIPNVVFKLNGSIMVSSCELRISGTVASTNYKWVGGKYLVFELPEDKRLQIEASRTWELWCNVDGEAGQTVTPQLVWPAPYFWFFDNIRVLSAGAEAAVFTGSVSKEAVAPNGTRLSVTGGTAAGVITLAGASITLEVVNLNNVTNSSGVKLSDQKTNGTTNEIVGVYKAKVRGSKATVSNLNLIMTGAQAAKGMTLCQIKIGQRTDKGTISTVSVSLVDFSLSNFGSEANVLAVNVPVTATKQMQVGDWLIIVECDVTTAGAAYANNDVMAVNLNTGAANVSFDVGTTAGFPTAPTAATTITIKLLTSLTVASNNTPRFLVANATDTILGEYTITGPTQEGVNVTSIGITFVAGVTSTAGCTTVTLKNVSGTELSTSQSLTGAGTLTFSVSFTVASNAEYKLRVVCVQASSAPTPAAVATATTFASVSGTGASSSQSFNLSATSVPAFVVVPGATVTIALTGTLTVAQGTNQPAQLVGPSEQLKVLTVTVAASIHEDQSVNTLIFTLTENGGASGGLTLDEIGTITVKAEGFTVSGTAAAAEQTVCTRTVTGTAAALTVTCNFADTAVVLGASQTGILTFYATGNTLGSIGSGNTAATDFITPSIAAVATDIIMKGTESQTNIVAGAATLTGRVITPAGSTLRVVSKSLPSTTLPGATGMVLAKRDVIVGGSNITLNRVDGLCNTSDAVNVCVAGTDTVDLVLDGTVIAAAGAIAAGAYSHTPLTNLMVVGTHDLESRYNNLNATKCSTGDTVQLTTNRFDFTSSAVAFAALTSIIPDFNTYGSNNMTHPSNLCG